MKIPSFKGSLPYLAAIGLFVVIVLVYFNPLLEGKSIYQSDIANFTGGAKEMIDYRQQTGEEALWTNSMFGGMPGYQISIKYTGNMLRYLDKIITLGLPRPADMVFLYLIGFFFLMIVMGVNPWLATAGAIGFAFSSYFFIIIDAGHNSKAVAIGYLAPILAGLILTMRKKYLIGGLVTAVFLSLELKANHPQIAYYFVMMAVIFGITELIDAIRKKEISHYFKAITIIFIAGIFALLTNINTIWGTYEYGKETIRGKSELSTNKENRTSGLDKDYATQWSYGIGETMTFLVPHLYGSTYLPVGMNSATAKVMRENNIPEESIRQFVDQRLPMYWGKQPFTSGPVYVGAIMFFLFILGLFIVKGPLKWWLLSSTILAILLSWGHNFMAFTEFFFNYVPLYNKFRTVSMILIIAELAVPIVGILAIKELLNPLNNKKFLQQKLFISFAITAGIALILSLIPGVFFDFNGSGDGRQGFPDWLLQGIKDDRMRMLRTDSFRSFVFILLGAGTLWAILFKKLKLQYGFIILIGLILIDMYPVNKRYLNNDSFTSISKINNPFEPTEADLQILRDNDPDYRVLNLSLGFMSDASTSYFHKSIGGYHGAKLRRYQEVVDYCIEPEINNYNKSRNNERTPVINMLNTKYIIVPLENKSLAADSNENALGNAWFIKEFKIVNNADEEIASMMNFDPASTAIIDKRFSGALNGLNLISDSTAKITLKSYLPNNLKYNSSSNIQGLAVFSEIYYAKGWNAFIDGQPAPYIRANYILRAMVIPAGNHEIEFKYEPAAYFKGETISFISSLILLLIIAGVVVFEVRKALSKEK